MKLTAGEIAQALGGATKLGDGGWKCQCPAHRDDDASLSVRDSKGKVLVRCHAGCAQDQVIDGLRARDLWPRAESKATWTPVRPVPPEVSRPTDVKHPTLGSPKRGWEYLDERGQLVGFVFRFEETGSDGKVRKTPMPMSWCESDEKKLSWRWKSFDKPRPMYGLQKLAARPRDPVLVVEGEKSCDAATELFPDHVCLSWPGGTKAVKYVDFKPLAGRDVKLWPDADDVGRKAMTQAAEILFLEGARSVRVVPVPEWVDDYKDELGEPVGKGWDVADALLPGMPTVQEMLDGSSVYDPEGDDVVAQLNKRFAFVLMGGKAVVLRETHDPDVNKTEISYLAPDAFSQYYSNNQVPVGRGMVPAGRYWLTHESRRSYEGITFAPGRDLKRQYNLWRGFSIEPDPNGDWSIFREHLLENAAQGNREHYLWILGWFAQMFQSPSKKTGTSLSFRGKQGTGKTIIGQVVGHLMHNHYTLVTDSRYLFGNFNSHMASTILLHSDESFWGGDPRNVGKLKALVTSDTHRVEYKRIDPVEIPNYMRLLITTNEDWVVPAASEERRFAVFDMGSGKIQDNAYFVSMLRQLRDGGYAGLLHYLLTMDLSEVALNKIPDTAALREQKETSLSDVAKYWVYCLTEGEIMPGQPNGWPKEVLSQRLYESLLDHLERWGSRYRPSPTQFSRELRSLAPPGAFADARRLISGKKHWCLLVPDLEECRDHFDSLYGSCFEWKREVAEEAVRSDGEMTF
jgi:hypothetical protein